MRVVEREILLLLSKTETDIGRFESKADIRLSLRDQFTSGQVNYAIAKLIKNGYIKTVMNRGLYQITSKGRLEIGVTQTKTPEVQYPDYLEKEEPIKDLSPEGLRKLEQDKPKAKWTPQRFEYDEETDEYKVVELEEKPKKTRLTKAEKEAALVEVYDRHDEKLKRIYESL